jgi:hypothetical protein
MPTLSTRVSNGGLKAITEYANACGLSVSDLIKIQKNRSNLELAILEKKSY